MMIDDHYDRDSDADDRVDGDASGDYDVDC